MKLYVFTNFENGYIGIYEGLAFAIADNITEAKNLIETQCGYKVLNWGILEEHELTEKLAFSAFGD